MLKRIILTCVVVFAVGSSDNNDSDILLNNITEHVELDPDAIAALFDRSSEDGLDDEIFQWLYGEYELSTPHDTSHTAPVSAVAEPFRKFRGSATEAFDLVLNHTDISSADILARAYQANTSPSNLRKLEQYIEKFEILRSMKKETGDVIIDHVRSSRTTALLSETTMDYAVSLSRRFRNIFQNCAATRPVVIFLFIRYCLVECVDNVLQNICPLVGGRTENVYYMPNNVWRRCLEVEGSGPFLRFNRSFSVKRLREPAEDPGDEQLVIRSCMR